VIDEGFDAVIRAGEVTDSRLMNALLGEYRLKLVASPDYLKRRGVPQCRKILSRHACLHHRTQPAASSNAGRCAAMDGRLISCLLPR